MYQSSLFGPRQRSKSNNGGENTDSDACRREYSGRSSLLGPGIAHDSSNNKHESHTGSDNRDVMGTREKFGERLTLAKKRKTFLLKMWISAPYTVCVVTGAVGLAYFLGLFFFFLFGFF